MHLQRAGLITSKVMEESLRVDERGERYERREMPSKGDISLAVWSWSAYLSISLDW
jgi:hypothetical protein